MPPYYLLYYLFGENERYRSELLYSLLSLKKVTNKNSLSNINVKIYSDHIFSLPDQLNFINISFITIEKEIIESLIKEANGHFFIVKPMLLLQFQNKYNAPCILMDTDTFFIKSPVSLFKRIAKHTFLIHADEYPISMWNDLVSFFERKTFTDLDGNVFTINSNFYMFNCGVIGFYPECTPILRKVINLVHQISGEKDLPAKWLPLIEQISFSYYIQQSILKKAAADDSIIHYWFFKGSRHFLANKLRYFNPNDEDKIIIKGVAKVPYSLLPLFIIKTMQKYSLISSEHFKCFPPHTLIGRYLRDK